MALNAATSQWQGKLKQTEEQARKAEQRGGQLEQQCTHLQTKYISATSKLEVHWMIAVWCGCVGVMWWWMGVVWLRATWALRCDVGGGCVWVDGYNVCEWMDVRCVRRCCCSKKVIWKSLSRSSQESETTPRLLQQVPVRCV